MQTVETFPPSEAFLKERLCACHETYVLYFAGQKRLTCDLDLLDRLIAEVEKLWREALKIPGKPTWLREARTRLDMYRKERKAMARALKKAGPQGGCTARLAQRVGFLMHDYTRHFAGQPRNTRDASHLLEISQGLKRMMDAAGPAQDAYSRHFSRATAVTLGMLDQEYHGILHAQKEGSLFDQAVSCAGRVNTLLKTYQTHFMQRRYVVCSAPLLKRLRGELETLEEHMDLLQQAGLPDPLQGPVVDKEHRRKVQREVHLWHETYEAMVEIQSQCTPSQKLETLEQELDRLIEVYNHTLGGSAFLEDPATRIERCGKLCDVLGVLEQQLHALRGASQEVEGLDVQKVEVCWQAASHTLDMLQEVYDRAVAQRDTDC